MDAVERKKAEMKAKIERERIRMHAQFQEQLAALAKREEATLATAEIEVEVDALAEKRKELVAQGDAKEVKAIDEQLSELNFKSKKLFKDALAK